MIRIKFAAWLLRRAGAVIEYRVQRLKGTTGKDGTTVLRTTDYKEARTKLTNMRVADTDTIVIRLVATTNQRKGEIHA